MVGDSLRSLLCRARPLALAAATLTTAILAFSPTIADATQPVSGAYIQGTLAPGIRLTAAGTNWPLPIGVTMNFTWYRCDSFHAGVELTTETITIPSDCTSIKGPLGMYAGGSNYTIDSDVAAGENSDEGKFITCLIEDDDITPKRSLAETTTNFVIMNRNGGTNATDGLRIILSNGTVQVIRNNTIQIYSYDGTGSAGSGGSGAALLAEGKLLVPQDPASRGSINKWWADSDGSKAIQEAWDSATTEVVSENLSSGSFVAKTVFEKTFAASGRHYEMTMEVSYKSPSQLADLNFTVTLPSGVTTDVHLYYAMDMFLDGDDYGPGKTALLGPSRLVAQYNATGFGGLLEGNGLKFTSWVEDHYLCVFGFPRSPYCPSPYGPIGTPYPNTVNPNREDSGVAGEWNLGTGSGTLVRQAKLAFASSKSPAINVSYSQSAVGTNQQVLTLVNVLNSLNTSRTKRIDFALDLPSATYGSPVSNCDGTVQVDSSVSPPRVTLVNGNLLYGDPSNPGSMSKCQIAIPTTFTTTGTKTFTTDNLVSSYWKDFDNPTEDGPMSDLVSDSILVTNGGPVTEVTNLTVTTDAATSIATSSATLNGSVITSGLPADATFCWGTDSALSGCADTPAVPDSIGPDDGETSVTAALIGLSPGTKYYYRLSSTNGADSKNGTILSFTTNNCWEELMGGNIGANEHVLRFTYSPVGCTWPVPSGVTSVQALLVGGGGGGGAPCVGGGGGGGGVKYLAALAVSGSIPITVGRGGSGGPASGCNGGRGVSGESTSVGTLASVLGGGGGGSYNQGFSGGTGGSGGGGSGGAGGGTPDVHYGLGGAGTPGQGNDGGSGDHDIAGNPGGGGGGAGGVGGTPVDGYGGSGGDGYQSDISGSHAYYGAGGGGGSDETGKGGVGGSSCGGNGATGPDIATAGANYGCGGGGGNGGNSGAAGANGVVIIRYALIPPTATTTTTSTTSTTISSTTSTSSTSTTSTTVSPSTSTPTATTVPQSSVTSGANSVAWKKSTIYFRAESAVLDWRAVAVLKSLLPSLRRAVLVTVSGFTHREGPYNSAHSRVLSRQRAINVRWWLGRNGVRVSKMDFFGNTRLASSSSEHLNRRAVISWH